MVKSSLTGSILGNLLFGLGVAFFAGGIHHRRNQRFDTQAARTNSAMLTLASFGLIIPAVTQFTPSAARGISREIALVLFLVYLAGLVDILLRQRAVLGKAGVQAKLKEKGERPDEVSEEPAPRWSRIQAISILALVTIGLAVMSEVLTGALEPASRSLNLSPRFAGVFLLALVGNAAELFSAVRFARKDQMDLCVGVTVGASVQVGLLVAPVLVFLGIIMGQDMDLVFSSLELIAIVMAIYLTRNLTYDGESSWLEGLLLIGVYVMFGIGFFHFPGTEPPRPPTAPPAGLTGLRPAAATRPASVELPGPVRPRREDRPQSPKGPASPHPGRVENHSDDRQNAHESITKQSRVPSFQPEGKSGDRLVDRDCRLSPGVPIREGSADFTGV
jgi:Ca2+:H+ antiporter